MDFSNLTAEEWLLVITTILILPVIIFALIAQFRVMSQFGKYSQVMSMSGQSGFSTARRLLDQNGLNHVNIEHTRGTLSDHYDPRTKVVRLSDSVYNSTSLAALAVAAHEVGHAVQDATNYPPLKIRQLVIKTTRLINVMLLPLIVIGFLGMFLMPFFMGGEFFFWFIIALTVMYGLSALINVITLPTEFDASRRAKKMLEEDNVIQGDEMEGVSKTLGAAALTYVAALAVSLVYFLRFLSIALILAKRR